MDIAFVLPHRGTIPSGGFKVVYEYSNYLLRKGHKVTIYYMLDGSFARRRIIRCLPRLIKRLIGWLILRNAPSWFALDKAVHKKSAFDERDVRRHGMVIATAYRTALLASKIPSECHMKKVYFIQDQENWDGVDEAEVARTYAMGMNNIVISRWLGELVYKYSRRVPYYVSNGINGKVFKLDMSIRNKPAHSICFQYREGRHKGGAYAIEAIRILREKYSDLIVTVVSKDKKPDNLPGFCKYIYCASPAEVAEANNSSAVFLCSSIKEGFGLPGLEAMACGCALVSSRYEGVLEYAVDGENALLVTPENAEALATAVSNLFDDEEKRVRIAKNGLKTARERTLEKSAARFEAVLMEIEDSNLLKGYS